MGFDSGIELWNSNAWKVYTLLFIALGLRIIWQRKSKNNDSKLEEVTKPGAILLVVSFTTLDIIIFQYPTLLHLNYTLSSDVLSTIGQAHLNLVLILVAVEQLWIPNDRLIFRFINILTFSIGLGGSTMLNIKL